jgi:hypothetical protein
VSSSPRMASPHVEPKAGADTELTVGDVASVPVPPLPPATSEVAPTRPAFDTRPTSLRGESRSTSGLRPTPSTLEAETRLLRDADVALRSGDAQRALALLDEHAARFPDGVLQEERAAERVLALCGLGRTSEARADVDRFLRERPRSPLADRVRSSCVAGDGR